MEQQNGILILNKPPQISSAGAIGKIKRLGQKKIGHAGTLDPMATGVLIVLLGQATKLSNYLLEGGNKTYTGELKLGTITDTWDIEGQILEENDFSHIKQQDIENEVNHWLNSTSQIVPPYSAAKHQGQPLYKLARAGKETPVKTKDIKISQAQILSLDMPYLRFSVSCSSGSYIRSLAHSLGSRLKCGACLTKLTRTYSHPFDLSQAQSLESIVTEPETLPQKVLPIQSALPSWLVITVDQKTADDIKNGKVIFHQESFTIEPYSEVTYSSKAFFQDADKEPLALMQACYAEGQSNLAWSVLRGMW